MDKITYIDSQTLNGAEGIVFRVGGGSRGALQINTTTRNRAGLSPAVDSYVQTSRTTTYRCWQAEDSTLTRAQFNELVMRIFYPAMGKRTLTGLRGATTYTTEVYVRSIQDVRGAEGTIYEISLEMPTGVWVAATPVVVSAFTEPVTITGNIPALPLISVTGGDAVTRQRITYTDRTGHGVSAYMVSVAPEEDNLEEHQYVIYANGLQIPFTLESGRLYFRVDCPPPPDRTYVDIYQGAAINNTVTAGRLDAAGLTLNAALSSGTVEADTDAAISNPLAPSLAWHPSITYRHESRRPYVYGLDGNDILLVDSDVARDRPGLSGDVDSYVIVTGVEAERIRNLGLTIQAGYQPSIQEAATEQSGPNAGKRVQRIIVKQWEMTGEMYGPNYPFNPHVLQMYSLGIKFGAETYTLRRLIAGTGYDYFPLPTSWVVHFLENIFTEATITTGPPGWFYIWFDEEEVTIPLVELILSPAFMADLDSPEAPPWVSETVWVDPVTLEPLDSNPETSDLLPDPIRGMARAVVKYRTRDSEHWITAWSREVVGSGPSGTLVSLSGLNIATPGAVQIAIGLEPVAKQFSNADWGRLRITSTPTIDLVSSRMPGAVVSAPIEAMQINEVIRNHTTGARLQLKDYLADGGLEIDVSSLQIRGAGGVGPTYGDLRTNQGAKLFDLVPGENDIEATENVSIAYRPRLAV